MTKNPSKGTKRKIDADLNSESEQITRGPIPIFKRIKEADDKIRHCVEEENLFSPHNRKTYQETITQANINLFFAIQKSNRPQKNTTKVEKRLKKVKKYLSRGADINAKDANSGNNTPLHTAVDANNLKLIELLLSMGADVSSTNSDDKTPLAIAEDKGRGDIVRLLEEKGNFQLNKKASVGEDPTSDQQIQKRGHQTDHEKDAQGSAKKKPKTSHYTNQTGSNYPSKPTPTEKNRVVKWSGWYTEEEIKKNSNILFLFGDNDNAKYRTVHDNPGGAGQAKATRPTGDGKLPFDRLPEHGGLNGNAIGITTTFCDDSDIPTLKEFQVLMDNEFNPIKTWVREGGCVVIPCQDQNNHNLGTGIAQLNTKIPDAIEYIQSKVDELVKLGKERIENPSGKGLDDLKVELHKVLLEKRYSRQSPNKPVFKRRIIEKNETNNSKKLRVKEEVNGHDIGKNVQDMGKIGSKDSETYAASGLKRSLHGAVYQLKLLMLFLKRGLNQGYSFNLATEMDAAEKFDDVVFQYTEGGKKVYRFLQAKHKQDDNKKTTVNDLLTEQDDEFSLQKYFISYRKIKQNLEFKDSELKDFVICTNIGLEESLRNSFEQVEGEDNILRVNGEKSELLKLKLDKFPNKKDLVSRLSKTSELNRLAKRLAECVFKNKPLDLKDDLFRSYHGVLGKKIIDVKNVKQREEKDNERKGIKKSYARFHSNFLDGSSQELENFRSAFLEAYQDMSKEQMDVNEFWQKMREKELQISKNFGKVFELDTDPQLTDSKMFAKAIVDAINGSDQGVVAIKREISNGSIIKDNIGKLAGYALIKKKGDEEKGTYYFSSAFFDDDNKLPGNLENFKSELKAELESKGIEFDRNKYKFRIANFKTCEEEQLDSKPLLPDDYIAKEEIDDFLDKLVFAVNQPNEVELGNIIEAEMGEEKNINLIDSEFIASKFQKDMLDWVKQKGGRFISCEDGKNLFEEAGQKLSKLVLIGLTIDNHKKIKDLGIRFENNPKGLSDFLKSEEKGIFNLVSPEIKLGSIRVCQTLDDTREYEKDDSHIFISLSSLPRIKERVMSAFASKEGSNLLVIECDVEINQKELGELSGILKTSNCNKKIIFINQENSILANKVKEHFPKITSDSTDASNFKYMEKIEGREGLTSLTDESQTKLLEEGKVVFQGREVSLGTLISKESRYLVGSEVLSKIINGEKIEIGQKPEDSVGVSVGVKDYVPRVLTRKSIKKSLLEGERGFYVINSQNISAKLEIKEDQDIVVISDEHKDFEKICEQYKGWNVHLLKEEENGKCIFQESHGNPSKLRRLLDKDEKNVEECRPDKITDISDRVTIITGKAGMGKSTLLTHLALKEKSDLWIGRIKLVDHSHLLKEYRDEENEVDGTKCEKRALKFLFRTIDFKCFKENGNGKGKEQKINSILELLDIDGDNKIVFKEGEEKKIKGLGLLEVGGFIDLYNKGKVALLFDGFDEIIPNYGKQATELLGTLKNTKVGKLWVITRSGGIQNELEDKLGTFSYYLEEFDKKGQTDFLKGFWKKELKLDELNERSDVFIEELLRRFSESTNDQEGEFVGVSLQIYMIAEVFKDIFKEYYDSNNQELSDEHIQKLSKGMNLIDLYDKFIEMKFTKWFEKENPNYSQSQYKPCTGEAFKEQCKANIEKHEKLALYALFDEDELKELIDEKEIEEVKELIKEMEEGKNKVGIIEKVVDGKPRFIHRTFAEYFAAGWFAKKKEDQKVKEFLSKNILLEGREVLMRFFDYKLAKSEEGKNEYELHVAVLNNDERGVKALLEDNKKNSTNNIILKCDKGGRTALHLAAVYGRSDILEILLANCRKPKEIVNAKNNLFNFSVIDYAYKADQWDIFDRLIDLRADEEVIFQDIEDNEELFTTLLCVAAEKGLEKFARMLYLIRDKSDVNKLDSNGYGPLDYAIMNKKQVVLVLLGLFDFNHHCIQEALLSLLETRKNDSTTYFNKVLFALIEKGGNVSDALSVLKCTPKCQEDIDREEYIRNLLGGTSDERDFTEMEGEIQEPQSNMSDVTVQSRSMNSQKG